MAEKCKSKNYVADVCKELMSRATFGTVRNIIRAATYAQQNASVTSPAESLASFLWALYRSHTRTVPGAASPNSLAAAAAPREGSIWK